MMSLMPRLRLTRVSSALLPRLQWQPDENSGPLSFPALRPHLAAMPIDDLAHVGQADARAADAAPNVVAAPEAVKNVGQILRGYTNSMIAHADGGPLAAIVLQSPDLDANGPALRAVLR